MPTRVGLVQINEEFSGQWYFPYAAGLLEAYARRHLPNPDGYEFLPTIFRRERVAEAVARLKSADIVGFTLYSWNEQLSMRIVERLKRERPSTLIVCGGPQVPRYDRPWEVEEFHQRYPSVDLVVHGAGEVPFLEILQHGLSGWDSLVSVSYRVSDGTILRASPATPFTDLSMVPDPYLAGVFDPLVEMYPSVKWIGGLETSRNCHWACTFCSWPMGPLLKRPLEEVFRTLERCVEYGTLYIFIFDPNFGVGKERDVAIAEHLAKLKRERGLPRAVNVQDGKNIADWVYHVRKALISGGIDTPAIIALQSIHPPTLKAIKRINIKTEHYQRNQQRFAAEGILTMTDLILGLPEETRESFEHGVGEVINWGQHNRIHFNILSMTPDAEMTHRDQRSQHGIETVWIRMVNMHGVIPAEDEVPEYQEIAIATRTMPREDWVQVRAFGWMTNFLHLDKILQIPLIVCREVGTARDDEFASFWREHGVNPASFPLAMQLKGGRLRYNELIGRFLAPDLDPSRFPLLIEIRDFFLAKARAIQAGEVEYCHSPEWLDIYWPADEYIMIRLVREGSLDQFYGEAEELLAEHVVVDRRLFRQAAALNRALLKLPFRTGEHVVECDWNVFEVWRGVLVGRFVGIIPGRHRYRIDWSSASWDSWERWYREVVWWCNRGGDYFLKPQAVAAEPVPAGHRY